MSGSASAEASTASAPGAASHRAGVNPFVGPRPLKLGERLYGREREISELHLRLNAERIVLLHSPSGAGKSSLVQAGLLPLLARSFDVWGPTRVNAEPAVSGMNRYTLSAVQGFEEGVPENLRRPVEVLAEQSLAGYFEQRPRRRTAPQNVVLIFDQFEEILTVDSLAVETKHELFEQLGELLRNPRVWALFALREDYLAPLDPYAAQVPTHLKNRFRIDLLGLDAAREAIVEPAREGGREFPAVDELVTDLATMKVQQPDGTFVEERGQHVEPVQLQVVCRRLWEAMPPEDLSIDAEDLERFGDVTEVLATYYADSVERIAAGDPGRERAIRDWFGEKLITAGGIRGQVPREAVASGGLANELIEGLRGTHLIRAEQRASATWYELAHDRLIKPVQRDNAVWREKHLAEAQRQAALWERQGRLPGLLLADAALAKASGWEADNAALVTDVERRFLAESRKAQEQADKERRNVRWIGFLAFGATVTAIVAVVALAWAWRAYKAAKQEALLSASRELALQSSQLLDKKLDLALLLAREAGRIAPTIEARRSLFAALQHNPRLWRFLPSDAYKRLRVAFRPGGSMLAAAGDSETIELWDHDGRPLPASPLRLAGAFEVRAIGFSPDGRWLAAGGKTPANGGLLGLWDVSVSPPRRYVTPEPGTVVRSLAFCRQGRETRLAWNTKDELSLWPLRGTEKPHVLQKGQRIARIAMTQDCARLAVGEEWAGTIELWSFTGLSLEAARQPLPESVSHLKQLAFDPAGQRLAAAGKEKDVSLWNLSTSQHRFLDAGTPVRSLAFRPNGTTLAAAGDTGILLFDMEEVELWDSLVAAAGEEGINLSGLAADKQELETFLLVAGEFLLEREKQKPKPLTGHDGAVAGIAFDEAGDVLASAGEDGRVILWRPDSNQRLGRLLEGHGHSVWAVSFSPNGRSLVSAEGGRSGEDVAELEEAEASEPSQPAEPSLVGSVRLWVLGTGEGALLPGNPGPSRAVAFSPNGRSIAAGSREKGGGTLHLWRLDGKSGKAVEAAQWKASKPVNAVAFSPDGRALFAAQGEDLVRWSLDPKPPRSQPLATHPGNIWSLLVRPATGSLLASDETGKVSEWDLATGAARAVLEPDVSSDEILASLAGSPDGHFVAAASWEGGSRCVYLWEMPSGVFLRCLPGHQEPVSAVAFAGDGTLISADDGGQLIFWDPQAWQEIGRVQHGSRINGLAVRPDGWTLAIASSDREILLLDLAWTAAVRDIAGRELTDEECEAWIHVKPKPASCAEAR